MTEPQSSSRWSAAPAGDGSDSDALAGTLAAVMASVSAVLGEEGSAAREGRSDRLEACGERKRRLMLDLEAAGSALREATAVGDAVPVSAGVRGDLEGEGLRLRAAIARNEADLRAATEAIRRIFESAAQALAQEDAGYGHSRLPTDARLFAARVI